MLPLEQPSYDDPLLLRVGQERRALIEVCARVCVRKETNREETNTLATADNCMYEPTYTNKGPEM